MLTSVVLEDADRTDLVELLLFLLLLVLLVVFFLSLRLLLPSIELSSLILEPAFDPEKVG